MKVVILAGGLGSRLSEETQLKPKPMVEIGDRPILWHIMKYYSYFGFNEFIILLGYKGYIVKKYFTEYYNSNSSIKVNLKTNSVNTFEPIDEDWEIDLVDTGINTMTGGRIKRIKNLIGKNDFMLTYGDGLSNVNINKLIEFHNNHKGCITMTSVQPEARFGSLDINDETGCVQKFQEKPKGDGNWINGGFFYCEHKIFDYIKNDSTIFEQEPLTQLAEQKELFAYKHRGFWQPMDTLREKTKLQDMFESGDAPWIKY